MAENSDDNVRDLSDKRFERHAERVRKSGGIPARRGSQFGGFWKADGDALDRAIQVETALTGHEPPSREEAIAGILAEPDGEEWLREKGIIE